MPKVSKEYSAACRQQIIDAAYRCFARKGFHQSTMRDIYEEAQLSPGAVYNYFSGKDAIIQASFEGDSQRGATLFANAAMSEILVGGDVRACNFLLQGVEERCGAGRGPCERAELG